ncbi:MAG: SMP-30/gluconolactonase/LRE family protein [Ilumatobacteraceae bacterium]|nr:SMP-30/gluconolactonase/LRE family protein [Ilumatobacteraceae bacterium]
MADTAFTEITTGLQFPEGPVAMPDGSVILTELFASRLTRVAPDGTKTTVAEINGSPNGLAIGPDGALYLCNNGNAFTPLNVGGLMYPGPFDESRYIGGRIQRVDIATGTVTDLYTHCGTTALRAPNDIVFDKQGGFYFTDHGTRSERSADRTGIYYAKPDGSFIEEVAFPTDGPNGIGLSPDENTLYWAETHTGRVYQRAITSPGKLAPPDASTVLCGLPGYQLLDSLAIDGEGNVCVATIVNGGITVISPQGEVLQHIAVDDRITTNICFGGPDYQTAYITASTTGRLLAMKWPYKGLKLNY